VPRGGQNNLTSSHQIVNRCMQEDGNVELEEEVASGLQSYFDKALGQMLLYAAERPKFEEQVPACCTARAASAAAHGSLLAHLECVAVASSITTCLKRRHIVVRL
jgi:MRG